MSERRSFEINPYVNSSPGVYHMCVNAQTSRRAWTTLLLSSAIAYKEVAGKAGRKGAQLVEALISSATAVGRLAPQGTGRRVRPSKTVLHPSCFFHSNEVRRAVTPRRRKQACPHVFPDGF